MGLKLSSGFILRPNPDWAFGNFKLSQPQTLPNFFLSSHMPFAPQSPAGIDRQIYLRAYEVMRTAEALAELYEQHKDRCGKYVHATSRGHEAIQAALGLQLTPADFVSPYYRDDCLLLAIGMTPYDLMLQLFAKKDDPFSGGRTYYSHPSLREAGKPRILHQSSATGMQAIPAAGAAQGLKYRETRGLDDSPPHERPLVVCSIGDGAMTEGEVSEALQMAALHQLPILFLVQDNEWGISASGDELYAQPAAEFVRGFRGIEALAIDGADFTESYLAIQHAFSVIRQERRPFLIQAKTPLLNHHTSGVRKEWYRDDLPQDALADPIPRLHQWLVAVGEPEDHLLNLQHRAWTLAAADLERAYAAPDPEPSDLFTHIYAPTPVTTEAGERMPAGAAEMVMVDAALQAVDVFLTQYPEALLYGQDVGGRLGGVFREAATRTQKHGRDRVFKTPIQEASIVGSTVGMSAAGCKPVVEVQFADYLWPALNQLFAEVSRSYYLSNGKWPVQAVIRVPIGAYGSGGPFHSSSIESVVLQIRGVKVVYPSNAADMKGLMRAALLDPNPVVVFEHKGLYWSKAPYSKAARTPAPSDDYIIPLGKGRIFLEADPERVDTGDTCVVVTYGMGVHWALEAARSWGGRVEVLDLRTLEPLDWDLVQERVKAHGKALVLTEEVLPNSFAEALAGRISRHCFPWLDAPVFTLGAENTPAIPLNATLEATMLPNPAKVAAALSELLGY